MPPNVEDIFQEADPVSNNTPQLATVRGSAVPLEESGHPAAGAVEDHGAHGDVADRRWLYAAIGVIVVGLLTVIVVIYWFLLPAVGRLMAGPASPLTVLSVPIPAAAPVTPAIPQPLGDKPATPQQPALPAQPIPSPTAPQTLPASQAQVPTLDSDHDGLSDAEERVLGTDPFNPDTDGDGLTDYDEVKVFGTDPKNPDTDGDGYKDGDEVAHGYNPKGPGKLLDFEGALNKK